MIKTIVNEQPAGYGRPAYIEFIDDKVEYDCSDGEYGPIEFSIADLQKALQIHLQKQNDLKINQ